MTIYILDNDPKKIAEYLDDRSLNFMIKDIAQVLCNVHWENYVRGKGEKEPKTPLNPKVNKNQWTWMEWVLKCKANYDYLLYLGISCDWELAYRNDFKLSKKYHDILEWCRENSPDLPDGEKEYLSLMGGEMWQLKRTEFPLVMTKKYFHDDVDGTKYANYFIESYRNYYAARVEKRILKLKECKICNGTWVISEGANGESNYCECYVKYPEWTKRMKPEWF